MSRVILLLPIAFALSCDSSSSLLESDWKTAGATSDAGTFGGDAGDSWTGHGDGCTPGGPASTLWSFPRHVGGLAVDATNAYWATEEGVYACAISGCMSPTQIARLYSFPDARSSPIAVDSRDVYFITALNVDGGGSTNLYRCPKSGCVGEPELVSTPGLTPTAFALDETSVYWTIYQSETQATVMRIGKDLTGLTSIASAAGLNAVSHGNIFWIVSWTRLIPPDWEIVSCPVTGCPSSGATLVAGNLRNVSALAVDDQNVYWTEESTPTNAGSVMSCPQSGCTGQPTVVASGLSTPTAISADACGVYWMTLSGDVSMCEKPVGNGPPTIIATGQDFLGELAVNAHGIFWSTYESGRLLRSPR